MSKIVRLAEYDLTRLVKKIIKEDELPNVSVKVNSIDDDAYNLLKKYFTKYPVALGYEYCASQMHPLDDTINYFRYELREPEHSDVRKNIIKTGKLTLSDIKEWIKVNKSEMIERKLI
jgi:hypothetical protein